MACAIYFQFPSILYFVIYKVFIVAGSYELLSLPISPKSCCLYSKNVYSWYDIYCCLLSIVCKDVACVFMKCCVIWIYVILKVPKNIVQIVCSNYVLNLLGQSDSSFRERWFIKHSLYRWTDIQVPSCPHKINY